MGIYEKLGLTPIVNATGAVTRLGGSRLRQSAIDAYQQASNQSVPLEQLQAAASRQIAEFTGSEAGLVTSGAAAALTLGAAAILAKLDSGRMEQLPHTENMPNSLLVAREHRSGYDHAVRASGARLVEVGFNEQVAGAGVRRVETWEYEIAISPQTAGILYVYHPQSHPPLPQIIEMAIRHNLPILVDAAGELPPRSNLRDLGASGVDLVAFSGGKAIGGPQPTGILCGRKDLVASAALQMLDMDDHPDLWSPPESFIDRSRMFGMPRHGIGRGMKVSKEAICALLAALQEFVSEAPSSKNVLFYQWLEQIQDSLSDVHVKSEIVQSTVPEVPPRLELTLKSQGSQDAFRICQQLRLGTPPVYVGHNKLEEGTLVINPTVLNEDQIAPLTDALIKVLSDSES